MEEKIDKRLIRGRKQAPGLSFEERKTIEKFLKEKWSCSAIGKSLGRGKNTIVTEVRRASINGKYSAKIGQRLTEKRKREGYEKMVNHPNRKRFVKGGINVITLNKRIENLENQLEIIIDFLKENMRGS